MAAAEPQDAAELLRLKMKYKYKYKYKYRTQHDMEEELVDDIWGIQAVTLGVGRTQEQAHSLESATKYHTFRGRLR